MIAQTITVSTTAAARVLEPAALKEYGFTDTRNGITIPGVLVPGDYDGTTQLGWGYQTMTGGDPKYLTPKGQHGHLIFIRQVSQNEIAPSRENPRVLVVTEGAIDAVAAATIFRTFNVVGAQNTAAMRSEAVAGCIGIDIARFYGTTEVLILADNDTPGKGAARVLAANIKAANPELTIRIKTPSEKDADVSDYQAAGGESGPISLTTVKLTDTNEGQPAQQKLTQRAAAAKTKTKPARRESSVAQGRDEVLKRAKERYRLGQALIDAGAKPTNIRKGGETYFECFNRAGHKGGTDNNPSLRMTNDGKVFYCDVCQVGGDQVSVAKQAYGYEDKEAIEHVVGKAELSLPRGGSTPKRVDATAEGEMTGYQKTKLKSERNQWIRAGAYELANYDKDGIPDYGIINNQEYYYDKQERWTVLDKTYGILEHAAEALLGVLPGTHDHDNMSIDEKDVQSCVARTKQIKLFSKKRGMLKAQTVFTDLVTLTEVRGMPWADSVMSVDHNAQRLVQSPLTKRHFTPGGQADKLRYIDPEDRPEPLPAIEFLEWFSRGDPGLFKLTRAILGRALLGDRSIRALPIFIGPGYNGKGVIIEILQQLLGDLTAEGDIDDMSNRFWPGTHLTGVQLLTIGDLANPPKSGAARAKHSKGTNMLKRLTGAYHDSIKIEKKYGRQGYKAKPNLTVVVASNHNPTWIRDARDSKAWESRIIPIPCWAVIDKVDADPDLAAKIIKKCGASVLASWLIDGYIEWLKDGQPLPVASKQLLREIVRESISREAQWVVDRLTPNANASTVNEDGYADYAVYAQAREWQEPANQRAHRQAITRAIKHYHPETQIKRTRRRGRTVQIWQGVELKTPTGEHEQILNENERRAGNGIEL